MTTPEQIAKLREARRAERTPEQRALDAAELTADTLEAIRIELVGQSHALGHILRSPLKM